MYRLFHFPLPIEFVEILEKYHTSYIIVKEYVVVFFPEDRKAVFRFSKYIWVPLSGTDQISPHFVVSKYGPLMGLADITELKKKEKVWVP